MQPISFAALLQDEKGKLLERGMAALTDQGKALDFKSDFVPLFKIGTPIQIVPVVNDGYLAPILGETYLSTSHMLRMTAQESRALVAVKNYFHGNVELHTELTFPKKRSFSHPFQKDEKVYALIFKLSQEGLAFLSLDSLNVGQKLILELDHPFPLAKAHLEVHSRLDFSGTAPGYFCRFLDLDSENRARIKAYLEELEPS